MRSTQPQRLTIISVLVIIALFGLWLMTDTAEAALQPTERGCRGGDQTVTNGNDSGNGSLRFALDFVQACDGDTIDFAPEMNGETVTLASELMVFMPVTITAETLAVTISGDSITRIFDVTETGNLTLAHLTLANGQADFGGAIHNIGTLMLTQSSLISNTATDNGGALYNEGTATFEQTTFAHNHTNARGGVVINSGGALFVRDSRMEANSADLNGGAIRLRRGGTVEIDNSDIVSNTSSFGGGIFADGNSSFTLRQSNVSHNSASGGGGGLLIQRSATIEQSTIAHNSAARLGGGILSNGTLTLSNSTVSGNSAEIGPDDTGSGSGIGASADIEIINSTIVNNGGAGSGINMTDGGRVTLTNSIVANNASGDCVSTVTTVSHSLIADGSCAITDGVDGNIVAAAQIDALADNGASTPTHALLPISPALDAGSNAQCLATDQRGAARDDGLCDMGAFEAPCQTTEVVTENGDDGRGTLRRAVTKVCDGGTITFAEVMTITLASQIDIDKTLTVDAQGVDVVVSGNGATRIFEVVASGALTLSHVTLANAEAISGSGVLNHGTLTVLSSLFANNVASEASSASFGAAIATSGVLRVDSSQFLRNTAASGGAINALSGAVVEIVNSDFFTNTAGGGGGISSSSGSSLTVHDSRFMGNLVFVNGGAISAGGTLTVTQSQFISNTARDGGAISTFEVAEISDTDFISNTASMDGGAIGSSDDLTVTRSTFRGNSADSGGAIFHDDDVTVQDGEFLHNSARDGGAIYQDEGDITLINSTLSGNMATEDGGAILADLDTVTVIQSAITENIAADRGGAIQVQDSRANLILRNSTVLNNSASNGGGIHNSGDTLIENTTLSGNTASQSGGGIFNLDTLIVDNSTLSGNMASQGNGGGIYNNVGNLLATGLIISGNSAGGDGGGVWSVGTSHMTDSDVLSNTASSNGGGLALGFTTNTIERVHIANNVASGDGGGIYFNRSICRTPQGCRAAGDVQANGGLDVVLRIDASTIAGNQATVNGGGLYVQNGTATVVDSAVVGNSADDGGGIHNQATTVVHNTTISGNMATTDGGGLSSKFPFNRGSGEADQTRFIDISATLTNCTISGNMVTGASGAGGVASDLLVLPQGGARASVTLSLSHCTVTKNSGAVGGISNSSDSEIALTNNIIAGNVGTQTDELFTVANGSAPIQSVGNVFGQAGASAAEAYANFTPTAADFDASSDGTPTALTAILDPQLANNGGPTLTHALVAGSPARDFVATCTLVVDQRSFVRTLGASCDAGAFEFGAVPTAVALRQSSAASASSAAALLLALCLTGITARLRRA